MKVLYLAEYCADSYKRHLSIDNILCLDQTGGVDVVCRPINIKNDGKIINNNKRIQELEKKDLNDIDVIIQHILPSYFEYKQGVKNIGFVEVNLTSMSSKMMAKSCNIMDEIWVTCENNKIMLEDIGVTRPIRVVQHGRDMSIWSKGYKKIDSDKLKDKCVFYTIGEYNKLYNLIGVLRAYYNEFSFRDNVVLVINTWIDGQSKSKCVQAIKKLCDEIKKHSNTYSNNDYYPEIFIIESPLSEDQINQLHVTGDIFVTTDRGSSWDIFAHDAIGFGNTCLTSDCSGFSEMIGYPKWLVSGQNTPCFDNNENISNVFGRSSWFDPNLENMSSKMREFYNDWSSGLLCTFIVPGLTYEKIGPRMKKLLEV